MNDGRQEERPLDLGHVYAAFGIRAPAELAHFTFAPTNQLRSSPAPRPASLELPVSTWTTQDPAAGANESEAEGSRPVSAFPGEEWLQFPDTAVPGAFPVDAQRSPSKQPTGPPELVGSARQAPPREAVSKVRIDILREGARFFAALSDIMVRNLTCTSRACALIHPGIYPARRASCRSRLPDNILYSCRTAGVLGDRAGGLLANGTGLTSQVQGSTLGGQHDLPRNAAQHAQPSSGRSRRSSVSSGDVAESSLPVSLSERTRSSISVLSNVPQTPASDEPIPPSPVVMPLDLPTDFVRGPWRQIEVERLQALYETSCRKAHRRVDKNHQSSVHGARQGRRPDAGVDWEWIANQFGKTRSKHQICLQAVRMGLKSEWPACSHCCSN